MTMQRTPSEVAKKRAELGDLQIDVTFDGLDESQIKSVQLADGWHAVTDFQIVQFAIGRAHSPLTPTKTWTYCRYLNESGMLVYSPINVLIAVSPDNASKTPQSQQSGAFQRQ